MNIQLFQCIGFSKYINIFMWIKHVQMTTPELLPIITDEEIANRIKVNYIYNEVLSDAELKGIRNELPENFKEDFIFKFEKLRAFEVSREINSFENEFLNYFLGIIDEREIKLIDLVNDLNKVAKSSYSDRVKFINDNYSINNQNLSFSYFTGMLLKDQYYIYYKSFDIILLKYIFGNRNNEDYYNITKEIYEYIIKVLENRPSDYFMKQIPEIEIFKEILRSKVPRLSDLDLRNDNIIDMITKVLDLDVFQIRENVVFSFNPWYDFNWLFNRLLQEFAEL